jgi:hypothetical protein
LALLVTEIYMLALREYLLVLVRQTPALSSLMQFRPCFDTI